MGQTKKGRYFTVAAGSVFGRLRVLEELPPRAGRSNYRLYCRCACGTDRVVNKSELTRGRLFSCGCLQREKAALSGSAKRGVAGESNKRTVFMRYKRFAAARNLDFSLTLTEFGEITSRACCYCGAPPSNKEAAPKHYGEFVYSGIDRVDNKLGYTVENTVASCIQCNKAKGSLSVAEFKAWLSRTYNHLFT